MLLISFLLITNCSKAQDTLPADLLEVVEAELAIEGIQVTCSELRKLQQSTPKIVLLDARTKESYRIEHLQGAKHIGFDATALSVKNIWYINRNKKIVVYSTNGIEGKKIAAKLREMGFDNTSNLLGGIEEWNRKLLPTNRLRKNKKK